MPHEHRAAQNAEWAKKVRLWKKSGKNATEWCKENHTVYSTFIGWRTRLKRNQQTVAPQSTKNSRRSVVSAPFIEIVDKGVIQAHSPSRDGHFPVDAPRPNTANCASNPSGLFLECDGIRIHLSSEFSTSALRKCLGVLRGVKC